MTGNSSQIGDPSLSLSLSSAFPACQWVAGQNGSETAPLCILACFIVDDFHPSDSKEEKKAEKSRKPAKEITKTKIKRKRNSNNNNSNYEGLMSGYRPMNMKEERIYHEHPHTNNFSSLLLSSHVHNRNEIILNGHCQEKNNCPNKTRLNRNTSLVHCNKQLSNEDHSTYTIAYWSVGRSAVVFLVFTVSA